MSICFFFNDTATTEIYTLSLHDALPISKAVLHASSGWVRSSSAIATCSFGVDQHRAGDLDRDEGAVDGDVDGVADARPAALDQGEGEGTLQLGAAVAGGDVAEHRHRRGRAAAGGGASASPR